MSLGSSNPLKAFDSDSDSVKRPSGRCGPPGVGGDVGWGAQVLGSTVGQRGWCTECLQKWQISLQPLAGEGDRPHCPLTARERDADKCSPGVVVSVQGSVLGPSAKACPSFSWAFPAQRMVCVTEGSSHLAGVCGCCWQISPGAIRHHTVLQHCVFIPA